MCKYSVILAFETSCDDTSIAVIKNGEVVSIATKSTLEMFKKFGGIIPEIASRGHEANIYSLTLEVLEKAAIKITDVNAVAYTAFPGLPGSLHVGKIFAKALAHLLNVKLVKIDHMMGHAFSYAINNSQDLAFPMLSLVISGGNTILYLFSSITKYKIINQTTDDAVGECLDKIGRYLGMEYPGGVSLDKSYNPDKATLKTIKHLPPETNFSFAGIKSFVNNFVNKNKGKVDTIEVGSSCLKWCIDDIVMKLEYYNDLLKPKKVVIGGGVAANKLLANTVAENKNLNVVLTERQYTGDNAAMIGFYASLLLNK